MISKRGLISKAEDVADEVFRRSKTILPTIIRLCIVSTFIEDGLRMCFQWSEQMDYIMDMASKANCFFGYTWATLLVLEKSLLQLLASGFVLTNADRIDVIFACTALLYIVLLRTFLYPMLLDMNFVLKKISICGGLLLILADCKLKDRGPFARILSLNQTWPKAYLQFTGRILTVLMFATILHLDINFYQIIRNIIAITLMTAVAIGFKTRLSALLLVLWLTGLNCFWTTDSHNVCHKPMHEFLKNDFFQTLSVIGGLLMIVHLGPGNISIDDRKKHW